ncbi:MAG: BMP family protein [Candidatus Bipolaricaulia bacterium]
MNRFKVGLLVLLGVFLLGLLPNLDLAEQLVWSQQKLKVGVVVPASRFDQGWNQAAPDSIESIADELGLEVEIAEQAGYGDISPILRDWAFRGFDIVICHASGYQTVCPEVAQQTGLKVVIVENMPAVTPNLVADYETQAQEGAYLAGVLAGMITRTNTVGVVVSAEPPTWNFMTVGFAEGVHSVNPSARLLYNVIGDAAYEDAAGAKRNTEAQIAAGADVVFGQGDGATFGMLQAVQENEATDGGKVWFIDVIGDKRTIDPTNSILTSVLFDYSGIFSAMVNNIRDGTFGKIHTMTVQNGGVRLLAPPATISVEARTALAQAEADLLTGRVVVSAIGNVAGLRARLEELFPDSF